MTPETIQRINSIRQRFVDGIVTKEELKEAVQLLREERTSSAESVARARKTAKAAIPSASSLLDELGAI